MDEADALYSQALALIEANGLENAPESFEAFWGVSRLRQAQDRPADAEVVLSAMLSRQRRDPEADDSDVAETLNRLSSVLGQLERFSEAAEVQREAIELVMASRGADHPSTPIFLRNLASIYEDMSDAAEADSAWAAAVEAAETAFGPDDPLTLDVLSDLGAALYTLRTPSERSRWSAVSSTRSAQTPSRTRTRSP